MLHSSSITTKPRRRPVQKSFSGCSQCKARKIKCDERRPSCTQCSVKRVTCPGYAAQPRLRWSRKHEVLQPREFVPSDQNWRAISNEQRESAVSGISPSDLTYNTVGDVDWIARLHGINAQESTDPGPACSSGEHPSIPGDFNLTDAFGVSSQPESLAGDWGERLSFAFASADAAGSFSVEQFFDALMKIDHGSSLTIIEQQPISEPTLISEPSDSSPVHLSQESDLEKESHQDIIFCNLPVEAFDMAEERTEASEHASAPAASVVLERSGGDPQSSLAHPLVDVPSELVAIYFSVVCPILSTFDSEHNVFRTFVSRNWQHSVLLFHTIQSMAAAKMAWFMPERKTQAFESRSLALQTLHSDIARASSWNTELIFAVLLLGISSPWFEITDLGIVHLAAVQQAVLSQRVDYSDGLLTAGFFKDALIYWEMVSCVVSDSVTSHDYSKVQSPQPEPQKPTPTCPPRIRPHPWTGVTSGPQALFTRVARQIRSLRCFGPTSGPSLDNPDDFSDAVEVLDEDIWACHLPSLHDIGSVGDENTPAIHHLLLAEAYMFVNLYQLYSVFPTIRRKRIKWIKEITDVSRSKQTSWAGGQLGVWASILQRDDGTEKWLRFLGRSVIIRLEQIQMSSGTSCVQALLLLVAAPSLTCGLENDEEEEFLEARQFVLNRLSFLAQANLSAPIHYAKSVVLEIFKRLDVGVDVFWLDILQSMGTATIIG